MHWEQDVFRTLRKYVSPKKFLKCSIIDVIAKKQSFLQTKPCCFKQ